jgi:hypothetical protein
LPAFATAGAHAETGTLVVTTGGGHVVVVQLLPALAAAAVQVITGTLVVTAGAGQVVVV